MEIEGIDKDAEGKYLTSSPPQNNNSLAFTQFVPFQWGTDEQMYPRPEVCYSFRGYIRGGTVDNYRLFDPENLPPVRYILPIPRQVILLSGQAGYVNYYGY